MAKAALHFSIPSPRARTPNSTFRIDEARLFVEAPVWDDIYFYTELDLATRESTSLMLNVGELYLDFENVSKLWDRERLLNFRAGRFYIPFGEEYTRRFAIDNPLISHSVSDIWGSDDGVEIYGNYAMMSLCRRRAKRRWQHQPGLAGRQKRRGPRGRGPGLLAASECERHAHRRTQCSKWRFRHLVWQRLLSLARFPRHHFVSCQSGRG